MVSFQIWGRVEQVDQDRFMVVASAMSPKHDSPGTSTLVMTERAADEAEARERLARMIARLETRVRAGGGIVSSVDVQ